MNPLGNGDGNSLSNEPTSVVGKYGIEQQLDPVTADAAARFHAAMLRKLYEAQVKHGYTDDWQRWDIEEMRDALRQHVVKGDSLDVANIAMFFWARGESTA